MANQVINPQRTCAVRMTVVVPCVCMCVHSNLTLHTLESKKRGTNEFIAIREQFLKGDLAKNASFRSYAVIFFTSTYTQYKYTYNTQLVHVGALVG